MPRKTRKTSEEQTAGAQGAIESSDLETQKAAVIDNAGNVESPKRKVPPRGKKSLNEDVGSSDLSTTNIPVVGSAGMMETEVKLATTIAAAATGLQPSQAAAGQGLIKQVLYRVPITPE